MCLTLAVLLAPALIGAQQITAFEPPFGSPGEQVIISGSGFAPGALIVKFGGPNGVRDTTAQATAGTTIWAKVPAGATTGPIYVQVGSQSSSSVEDFLVLGNGPFITGFEPPYAAVGDNVIIHGWHLGNLVSVKFGGKNSTQFMANAAGSQITARVPVGATNGVVSVTTSHGTSNSVQSLVVVGAGPYMAVFSPNAGPPGTSVTIDGVHFTGVTNVSFNGRAGVDRFIESDTRMHVKVPPGVTTGRISVRSPLGSHTNAALFYAPPILTGFSPNMGRQGTNVVISGTNLLDAFRVTVGGQEAPILSFTNNHSVVVSLPVSGSGPVRITTPAGTDITATNLRYQPLITGFVPRSGTAGTVVAISGANLNEGLSALRISGLNAQTSSVTGQHLSATVPVGASTGPISVVTSNGTFSTADLFYLPPSITSVSSATSAPGSTVKFTGNNFLGSTNVVFNGVLASVFSATNNTNLFVEVPLGVTTGPVQVRAPGGIATYSTYYASPVITSFNPTHSLPGTAVTITGTSFTGASAVHFNGLAAAFTVVSNGTAILATVPTGATTGPISVTAPAGTVFSTTPFVIDFASDLSVAGNVSSALVFYSSNLVYTFQVANAGPFNSPNTLLSILLPGGFTVLSNTISKGTVSFSPGQVVGRFETLSSNQTATLRLFINARVLGPVDLIATISGDYPDPSLGNNVSIVSSRVLPLPFLSFTPYSPGAYSLSWPAVLTNYTLQSRNVHGPGIGWSNVLTQPTLSGTNLFIVEPTGSGSKLFRLKNTF